MSLANPMPRKGKRTIGSLQGMFTPLALYIKNHDNTIASPTPPVVPSGKWATRWVATVSKVLNVKRSTSSVPPVLSTA